MKPTKGERFLEAFNDIDDKYLKEAMNYTMKKKFNFKPIIAVAACAAFALAAIPVANHFANPPAVQQTEVEKIGVGANFTAYESGVHEGPTIGTHKIELKLNSSRNIYENESKKASTETIHLNGTILNGFYTNTMTKSDYREETHIYEGTSNGKKYEFGVNSVTGKCEFLLFKNTKDTEDNQVKLERDKLYSIAYENFKTGGYTEDPENYTLSDEGSNGIAGYWFKFSRFVGGIETTEYITISLRNNGDFYGFKGYRIGEMKNIDVSEVDMSKLYDTIEAKIKTIYGDAYVSLEKNGVLLKKLTNGDYVFEYSKNAIVKNQKGEIVGDRCILTILMD